MKSVLEFWMGWSLAFLVHAESPLKALIAAGNAILALVLWLYVRRHLG